MEVFLIKLLQFMLAIGLLVLLHEGGHFFFSKLFGVRVEKFYLFFDVTIAKWKGALFKFKPKKSDTEYGIGWLPLGGYCKIAGMIDESFDTEQMKQPEQPWEFRSKPAWQRLLIMIGGVLVNFLLALFIYSMVLFTWGETFVPVSEMSQGMEFNKQALELGFQNGDVLLAADGKSFKKFDSDLFRSISEAHQVDVLRQGQPTSIVLPGNLNLLEMIQSAPIFCRAYLPAVVDTVLPNTAAAAAGLQKGAILLSVNGKAISSYNQFTDEIGRMSDVYKAAKTPQEQLAARAITITYRLKDRTFRAKTTLNEELKLGFAPAAIYEPTTTQYGFFESFPAGVKYGWHVLASYVDDLKYVFTSDGVKSLGGFGSIGNLFPATWNWHQFWLMTAFLSIILAFMNILPIPALDGGHVLFLIYEMITHRKPSETFMIRAEYVGFGIVILLMIVANLNDILRLL